MEKQADSAQADPVPADDRILLDAFAMSVLPGLVGLAQELTAEDIAAHAYRIAEACVNRRREILNGPSE